MRDGIARIDIVGALASNFIVNKALAYFSSSMRAELAANHDSLTGLLNRRGMIEHITRHVDQAPDDSLVLLAIVDADDFKRLNDTFGHHYGDRALQTLAERLQGAVRDHDRANDAVARVGGDEFMLFFDLGDDAYSDEAIEDIKSTLRSRINSELRVSWVEDSYELIDDVSRYVHFEASVGMALKRVDELRGHRESLSDILRTADAELYADKIRPNRLAPMLMQDTTVREAVGLAPDEQLRAV